MDEEEAKARLRLIQIKKQKLSLQATPKPAPAPAPAPPPAEEPQPGFLERSKDRLQLGLSDAMASLAGDTYGRAGDTTQPDNLDPAGRTQKALFGDIVPAASEVGFDAVIESGKRVLPQAAQDAISSGAQTFVEGVAQSPDGQAVAAGWDSLKQNAPQLAASLEELANMGVLSAAKGPAKVIDAVTDQMDRPAKHLLSKAKRMDEVKQATRMMTPDMKDAKGDPVVKGILGKKTYQPTASETRMVETLVDEVDGFSPRRSHTHNLEKVKAQVGKTREKLDLELERAAPVSSQSVDDALLDAIEKSANSPTLVGDAGEVAEKIYSEFNRLLVGQLDDAGNIKAVDLMNVRRDLDQWLTANGSTVFDPEKAGATQIALRNIRNTINDTVAAAAPDDLDVKLMLQQQHDMLKARDIMRPRAWNEHETNIGRGLANLERTTGIRHPTNPQSIAITARNPVVQAAVGVGLPLAAGVQMAPRAVMQGGQRAAINIIDALRKGGKAGSTSAILEMINQDEEEE